MKTLPRYPIYIPSKGRAESGLTARVLEKDGVPFRIVVEPCDQEAYAEKFGVEKLLVLPFENLGFGAVPARNWIKEHAIAEGHARHWQLDDDLNGFLRWYKKIRIPCNAAPALACLEDFVDRYENVAIAGLNYDFFCRPSGSRGGGGSPPFLRNCRVYSCTLINNAIPHRWRGRYNDDTDICLQVLSDGWCTILFNAFMVGTIETMKMSGGMTSTYVGDGRLKMARALERVWPHVVQTKRRFKRPQHVVRGQWTAFDTPLKLKPGVDLDAMPKIDDYGMELTQTKEIKHPEIKKLLDDAAKPTA